MVQVINDPEFWEDPESINKEIEYYIELVSDINSTYYKQTYL